MSAKPGSVMSHFLNMLLFFILWCIPAPAQLIFVTDWRNEADVIVYVTKWESEADLLVCKTDWKSDADGKDTGIWFFTEWKSEGKKVYFTGWKSEADIIIYYTDWKSKAGWIRPSKQHYLD